MCVLGADQGRHSVLIWIQIICPEEVFEKVNFGKSQQMTSKAWNITQQAKSFAKWPY